MSSSFLLDSNIPNNRDQIKSDIIRSSILNIVRIGLASRLDERKQITEDLIRQNLIFYFLKGNESNATSGVFMWIEVAKLKETLFNAGFEEEITSCKTSSSQLIEDIITEFNKVWDEQISGSNK